MNGLRIFLVTALCKCRLHTPVRSHVLQGAVAWLGAGLSDGLGQLSAGQAVAAASHVLTTRVAVLSRDSAATSPPPGGAPPLCQPYPTPSFQGEGAVREEINVAVSEIPEIDHHSSVGHPETMHVGQGKCTA
jgi:hypothetical protein